MAFVHGKGCIIKIDDSTDTLRTLTAYISSAGTDQSVPTADTTVFGLNATDHVVGIPDHGEFQVEGPWDGTTANGAHDTFSSVIGQAASLNLEVHPGGTASGSPKLTGSCSLTKYAVSMGIDDAVKYTATVKWRGTAAWSEN